jgi:hypothetical protein
MVQHLGAARPMIDFPANPQVGDVFQNWKWDGEKWASPGLPGPEGPQGPPGEDGATGPPGAPGDRGPGSGANRILNSNMTLYQRKGIVAQDAAGYSLDRWQVQCNPAGTFSWGLNDSGVGSGSAAEYRMSLIFLTQTPAPLGAGNYLSICQYIEADMVSDFAWGAPEAKPVTLSFWVATHPGGTFSGSIRRENANAAHDRAYPFSYAVPADAWTKVEITIPGDVDPSQEWVLTGPQAGVSVFFCFGEGGTYSQPAGAWTDNNCVGAIGTVDVGNVSGGYYAVSAVKLETGTEATPYIPPSPAKNLADCQRYYQFLDNLIVGTGYGIGAGSDIYGSIMLPTTMVRYPNFTAQLQNALNVSGPYNNGGGPTSWQWVIYMSGAGNGYSVFNLICDAEL